MFRENMTPDLEEARSIGWQLAATKDSTGGADLPPDSFGHNGFTGTCVWIDPNHAARLYSPHQPHPRARAAVCEHQCRAARVQ